MITFQNFPRLGDCIKELSEFMPKFPKEYFPLLTNQILSDEHDYLSLFEAMMSNLEAGLYKPFEETLLEKFKNSKSSNVVSIYSKYCNYVKDSSDFETLVTALY